MRQRPPCWPFWTRWEMSRHWPCGARQSVWHPSSGCSSPGIYTSLPARMPTSYALWWNASKGHCRAWFIATWQPALLHTYNSTHHSTIGMAPLAVNWTNAEHVWERLYSLLPRQHPGWVVGLGHLRLSPGDLVRMSKTRRQFAKDYEGHWSKEIFWMEAMQDTSPVTYVVANAAGELIKGTIYGLKIKKVMPPDYFDVEAILDTWRRGNTMLYLNKWAGYPDSFNSWESDKIRISGESITPCQAYHHGQARGAPCLHSTPRWRLQHVLWTASWSFAAQQHQPGTVPRKHHHRLQGGAGGRLALDTTSTSGKSFTTWMGTAKAVGQRFSSAITPPGTTSWWPSSPGWRHARVGDDDASAVPATGLARLGDAAAGPGQHTPHGPIPIQAGPGREPLHALRPRRPSRVRQRKELPVVRRARGG